MSSNDICQICSNAKYKYICPRCNIAYCSVTCYKDLKHLKCSEEFYRQCVEDELRSNGSGGLQQSNKDDMRKIYDILKRIKQTDAGVASEDIDFDDTDESAQLNDSDDDNGNDDADADADELDLAERLKDIDINNSEEVWKRLTPIERDEFKKMIATGDIIKLMPNYTPWWIRRTLPKIIELPSAAAMTSTATSSSSSSTTVTASAAPTTVPNKNETEKIPKIIKDIPKFKMICKKEPSPCLHYNLWNILAAYTVTVRYFRGEHLQNANEACAHFLNLCISLKYGTNFDDVEDAIMSVEMEALSTNSKAIELMTWAQSAHGMANTAIESREQLQNDVRQIMSKRLNKLAALSDILSLFQLTKQVLKETTGKKEMEFQKLFAFSSGMEEITRHKLQKLIKKIIFYLSYVNRDSET